MRSVFVSALAAGVMLIAAPSDAESQMRRVRVAVLDLENTTSMFSGQNNFAKQASDQLVTALLQEDAFDVMERAELDAVIAEQDGSIIGGTDLAIALGELGTVDYVITGTVSKLAFTEHGLGPLKYTEIESEVNVRVINTATGRIEGAVTGAGTKRGASLNADGDTISYSAGVVEDALRPGIEDAAQKISALPLEVVAGVEPARVVGKGSDGSVYISQGENYGVQVGQQYEVLHVIDEIYIDGELVDRITEPAGLVEVTRVLSRSSVARVVEGEASEGDDLDPVEE